jgi:hypothetical protein
VALEQNLVVDDAVCFKQLELPDKHFSIHILRLALEFKKIYRPVSGDPEPRRRSVLSE